MRGGMVPDTWWLAMRGAMVRAMWRHGWPVVHSKRPIVYSKGLSFTPKGPSVTPNVPSFAPNGLSFTPNGLSFIPNGPSLTPNRRLLVLPWFPIRGPMIRDTWRHGLGNTMVPDAYRHGSRYVTSWFPISRHVGAMVADT